MTVQFEAVKSEMLGGSWVTLYQLQEALDKNGVQASTPAISARVRDLRKQKFGGYNVERRHVGGGLWEYRIANGGLTSSAAPATL